jgi:hypothetical protein
VESKHDLKTYGIWLVIPKEISRGEISSESGVAGRFSPRNAQLQDGLGGAPSSTGGARRAAAGGCDTVPMRRGSPWAVRSRCGCSEVLVVKPRVLLLDCQSSPLVSRRRAEGAGRREAQPPQRRLSS